MTTATRPLPDHGTLSRHKYHGCKCDTCTDNYRAYARNRHRRKGYGTWPGLVSADPVREHIDALRASGGTFNTISRAAGVPASTLANIMYGDGTRSPLPGTHANTAAKILALTPADLTPFPGTRIDSTGTRRRLQALIAIGWPLTALAPRMGFHPRGMTEMLRGERVTASTADAVRIAYRQLAATDPASYGITRQVIGQARGMARRRGWPPPIAWGADIDNPTAIPDFDRAEAGDTAAKRDKYRNEEIRHLASFGIPPAEIADRVGLEERDVSDRLKKWAKEARGSKTEPAA